MLSLNFFAFTDNTSLHYNRCSRKSDAHPFVVNCAGITATSDAYNTVNQAGRIDWYLLYVISGTLFVGEAPETKECTSGNFIIFPPNTPYHYKHNQGEDIECFWIHFSGSDVERAIDQYGFGLFPEINQVSHDMVINARYSNIFNTFVQNDRFRDRELSILFDRLLLSLAKRSKGDHSTKGALNKSINFINENYSTNIYIPDLARLENLSLSRYNTVFREVTGISPSDYIKQLRLNAACELLLSTDLPINEIGETVGYPNQCFFSKMFKRNIGVTPTEYRQNR